MMPFKPYALLALAIASEIVATSALKATDGFTKLGYVAVVVGGYALSFYLMAVTLKYFSVGAVYAIWSGVGTAAIALIGVFFFRESLDLVKVAGLVLIVAGVVLLNTAGGGH